MFSKGDGIEQSKAGSQSERTAPDLKEPKGEQALLINGPNLGSDNRPERLFIFVSIVSVLFLLTTFLGWSSEPSCAIWLQLTASHPALH